MKKFTIYIFILASIFLVACGGGSSGLKLNFEGGEKDFASKSSFTYHSTKTFSYTKDGNTERTQASITRIFLANFDLDTSQAMISVNKQKIDKTEQIKVTFAFTGAKESSDDEPIKPGEYLPENDRFQDIEGVRIHSFDGNNEKRTVFKLSSLKGKLVINSVTDEKITGSVDFTDGESSIKGSFTADAPKPRK